MLWNRCLLSCNRSVQILLFFYVRCIFLRGQLTDLNTEHEGFQLTYGIMFNNVVVSIISLLCFLFAMSAISRQYRLDTTDVTAAGYNFAIAAITEVFMVKEKYVIWLIIYHISVYVVSILTFCGPLIIICAIVRDIAERHRQLWTAWAIIAFCLSAFLASVPRSIVTFGDQWDKTIVMLKDCTTFFVVAIMIVAFVLVYGEREYVIDLSQLYPIKDGDRPWSSPAHPAQIGHFLIAECFAVVTMVMTFVYNFTGYTHSRLVMIVVAACVLFLVILAVIFGFLAYNAYGSIRRAEGMSTLLFVTPEHPSYWRITSFTQVGVDEQTDQLVSANRVTAPQ